LLTTAGNTLSGSPSARIDAEILMMHTLACTRAFLYANPEFELSPAQADAFSSFIQQRLEGQPVAYLTGSSEFWSLPLRVSPAVLIPRPETELLVETALEKIPCDTQQRIADLGTGSGAIALAIASERPRCELHATDISPGAIMVAQENADRLGFSHVRFHTGSWTEPLQGKFHLVVSNPPYVDEADPHLEHGDLRFEPRGALTPGADGLAAIHTISHLVHPMLLEGGWLMFEHGWDQGPAVRDILKKTAYKNIKTLQDLQGHERVTIGAKA